MARRTLTTAAVTSVLLILCAGCGDRTPQPGPATRTGPVPVVPSAPAGGVAAADPFPTPAPASQPPAGPAPDGGSGSAAGPAPTGGGWAPPALTAVPDPPRLLPVPRDFATAEAVAAAYLAAWCHAPAGQAANTNLRAASRWLTAAGWADDASRAVDEPGWARTRAAGVSTVCGPVTASAAAGGPTTATTTWVAVRAQQARVRGGALIGQSPVVMVRRVLRAPDGRWLVDVRVPAG